MDKIRETIIVIPAYKPSERLISLVDEISGLGYRVLVVDDGSGQESEEIFNSVRRISRTRVLTHEVNLGKGAALKIAFNFIHNQDIGFNYIVTLDADGQHLVSDMQRVAEASWRHPRWLILGSREFDKDVPFKSRLGNKITRTVFRMISGRAVNDTQTGLRAFNRVNLSNFLEVEGTRYEYEMNVLMSCKKYDIEIMEVPIETVYLDAKNSDSHFHPVRDAVRIYGNIIKFAGASFISFLADYLLFIIFLPLLSGLTYGVVIANVAARVLSAILNYTLNSKAVFKDDQPAAKTLPKYIALAAFILAANSVILGFFTGVLGIYPQLAKILTEILLFIISFSVQSLLIFGKKRDRSVGRVVWTQPGK